jgi:GH24 family phage-related lysozyme (muramidase)
MSRDWAVIASQYISKKEGFTETSSWDVNAYRIGYGTNKILDNGNLRDVRPDAAYHKRTGEKKPVTGGDRTTREDALKVLEMEIRTTYRDKVVGTGDAKITEADWNALNDRQRAGLVSFVYNCGSFGFYRHIPAAIKAKNYIEAANGILNGPISGKDTKTEVVTVYSGLIRRRAEEAGIFAYGL